MSVSQNVIKMSNLYALCLDFDVSNQVGYKAAQRESRFANLTFWSGARLTNLESRNYTITYT